MPQNRARSTRRYSLGQPIPAVILVDERELSDPISGVRATVSDQMVGADLIICWHMAEVRPCKIVDASTQIARVSDSV